MKNLVVLVPVLFTSGDRIIHALAAAAAFCLISGGVYIVNDLCDASEDRIDEKKRLRPIASGRLRENVAKHAATAAITIGIVAIWLLSPVAGYAVLAYTMLTFLYTAWAKQYPVLDALVIGAGFSLRLLAGYAVARSTPDWWLVAFAGAITVFFVAAKRWRDLPDNYSPAMLRWFLPVSGAVAVSLYWMFAIGTPFLASAVFLTAGAMMYLLLTVLDRDPSDRRLNEVIALYLWAVVYALWELHH